MAQTIRGGVEKLRSRRLLDGIPAIYQNVERAENQLS
jgi:hypothetical protein